MFQMNPSAAGIHMTFEPISCAKIVFSEAVTIFFS